MDDSNELSLSVHIFKHQVQASPIHAIVLGVDLWEVIFYDLLSSIDVEDIVDDIPSLEFLIMIHFRSGCEIYVIDEFLPILSDRQVDRLS